MIPAKPQLPRDESEGVCLRGLLNTGCIDAAATGNVIRVIRVIRVMRVMRVITNNPNKGKRVRRFKKRIQMDRSCRFVCIHRIDWSVLAGQ